jgi:hypothetical protein
VVINSAEPCWRPEMKKCTGAMDSWLLPMRWRYSGTWHKAGRRLSSVNLAATAAEHEGYGGESPELSPGAWLLLGGLIGSSAT